MGPGRAFEPPVPAARDRGGALRTGPVAQTIREHPEAAALDHGLAARRAARVLPAPHAAREVAGVDVAQSLGRADLAGPLERLDRRRARGRSSCSPGGTPSRARECPGETEARNRAARVSSSVRVVESRDDQRQDLEPDAALVRARRSCRARSAGRRRARGSACRPCSSGPPCRSRPTGGCSRAPSACRCRWRRRRCAAPARCAARKTSTAHSEVMSGSLYVETIVGAPFSTASRASSSAVTSRGGSGGLGIADRLRREPVLAVRAVQVAAEHAEGQRVRSGQRVEEGLLLDRVALQRADVTARGTEHAASAKTDPADALAPFRHRTAMAARVAAQPAVGQDLGQLGGGRCGAEGEGLREGGRARNSHGSSTITPAIRSKCRARSVGYHRSAA